MKIKVILVTTLLCITLSFFSLELFNDSLWKTILSGNENAVSFQIGYSPEHTNTEIVEILIRQTKNHQINLQSAFYSQGECNVFVLLSDPEYRLGKLPLLGESPLDFSDPYTVGYYSTIKGDPKSSGYLYTALTYGRPVYRIQSFNSILTGLKSVYGWYEVSGRNVNEIEAFMIDLQKEMPDQVYRVDVSPGSETDTKPRTELLYISTVLFLLILLMEVSKNMKEISLRKSMGESFAKILTDLFRSFYLIVVTVSLVTFLATYWIMIKTINQYTMSYIKQLLILFGLLNLLSLALLAVIGLILFLISPVSIIKNRNFNKALYNFNFVLKILFIVMLFPQFITNTQKIIFDSKSTFGYLKNAETLQSVVYMSGINPGSKNANSQVGYTIIEKQLKTILLDRYSFYLRYTSKDAPPELDQRSEEYLKYVYLIADAKILDYYPIMADGLPITVTTDPIAIIPLSKKGHLGFSVMDVCKNCKIITTRDSYTIPNYVLSSRSEYRNPVLIIYPTMDQIRSSNPSHMLIVTKTSQEAKELVSELTLLSEKNVVFTNNESMMSVYLSSILPDWFYIFVVFLQNLMILLMVIIHGITVLYQLNKKEIAVHYFLGYTFIKRSAYIVLQDLSIFILLTLFLSTTGKSMILSATLAISVALVDYILACVYLLINEKKQALEALKNG